MARLPAGTPATPVNVRLARYRDELVRAGGRRVVVDLEKEGADALDAVRERGGGLSIKAAVTQALIESARGRR